MSTTTYRHGVWTPTARVVCHQCHGTEREDGRGPFKGYNVETVEDIPEGRAATKCCECGADMFTDDKVAAEHNLVLALKAAGFHAACMAQTGGMCSAASLPVGSLKLTGLRNLAAAAHPINDDEWGSERDALEQVEAHGAFGRALREVLSGEDWEKYCDFALKALTEEMTEYGLRLAGAVDNAVGLCWNFYANDEEPDEPADRFAVAIDDEDGCLYEMGAGIDPDIEDCQGLDIPALVAWLTSGNAFAGPHIDAAKAASEEGRVAAMRREIRSRCNEVSSQLESMDGALIEQRYGHLLTMTTVFAEDVEAALTKAGYSTTCGSGGDIPADILAVISTTEHPDCWFNVRADCIQGVREIGTRQIFINSDGGIAAAYVRLIEWSDERGGR